MSLHIDSRLTPRALQPALERMFECSASKISSLRKTWNPAKGTPVFTRRGRYTSRGWTEWTQGFQYGSALLQFDATGEKQFLDWGRQQTVNHMATHVSHVGVHDHGFNNVSTYGNLRRLMLEGRIPFDPRELEFYEFALKVSGAIQAARWTPLPEGGGYIYSFNGPQSLFIDTLRSLRSLALGHRLGHVLMGERDHRVNLLERLIQHALVSRRYALYFGEGRDAYDIPGRVAHESLFNVKDGSYRCPNSQQGYSPFSTWTRGLAWAVLGYAEQLEFLHSIRGQEPVLITDETMRLFLSAARAVADRYLEECCVDGIPVWDTGAPNLHRMKHYRDRPSDPTNRWEPVDSSAAAIAAQGLVRLGNHLLNLKQPSAARRYRQAGLTIARTLLSPPYLSTHPKHQGLLLHSVYHRPNGWDYIAPGQSVPNGESSLWGDYHLLELGVLLLREARSQPGLFFYS